MNLNIRACATELNFLGANGSLMLSYGFGPRTQRCKSNHDPSHMRYGIYNIEINHKDNFVRLSDCEITVADHLQTKTPKTTFLLNGTFPCITPRKLSSTAHARMFKFKLAPQNTKLGGVNWFESSRTSKFEVLKVPN
jgi:hypothetical protein